MPLRSMVLGRVTVVALAVAACALLSGPALGLPERVQARYPDSMAVLGHSGSTGENSDPKRPGVEVRANSWATGTNPAVNSVYARILARNPGIKGHNVNLAQGGATVVGLRVQALSAVALTPKPELVLVQIMDNDIICPARVRDYAGFRTNLIAALGTLTKGLPSAQIFVVSQFGSPKDFARALTPKQRTSIGGTGPCAFLDRGGRVVPTELNRLERVVQGYEAELAASCKRFSRCHYDAGAFGRVVDQPEYVGPDIAHFSVAGHAKAAAVAWAALQEAGLIPR